MKKKDELADPKSCLNKAGDEDYIFVLKQGDPVMAATIRFWTKERVKRGLNAAEDLKIETAEVEAQIVELRQAGSNTEFLENRLEHLRAAMK